MRITRMTWRLRRSLRKKQGCEKPKVDDSPGSSVFVSLIMALSATREGTFPVCDRSVAIGEVNFLCLV